MQDLDIDLAGKSDGPLIRRTHKALTQLFNQTLPLTIAKLARDEKGLCERDLAIVNGMVFSYLLGEVYKTILSPPESMSLKLDILKETVEDLTNRIELDIHEWEKS